MFKLQSPSKYSPILHNTPIEMFFPWLRTVFEVVDFDAFQGFCCFQFHLFHLIKQFPLRIFSSRETNFKKSCLGQDWVNREGGHGSHAVSGQKLLNTQHRVGRCTYTSPIMKWENALKESSKDSPKPNTASHNNASWYTVTDGLLEHSPSRGSLYCKGKH